MEANQKILYENFKRLSVEGTTSIQREKCKGYAAEILKSFPQFEKKTISEEEAKKLKKNPETKSKKEK